MASKINDPSIGERLREARKMAERSQKWCAKVLGVAISTYQRYENGLSKPKVSDIKALAEALNVSVDDLLEPKPAIVLMGAFFSREEAQAFKDVCKANEVSTEELIHDIVKAIADGEILVTWKDKREVVDHAGISM